MLWTPSDQKMRPIPSPVATATTAVRGGGPIGASTVAVPSTLSRTQRPSSTPSPPPPPPPRASRAVPPVVRRPPAAEPGLARRPHVVGVDVAVPQAVAADDDD